MREYLIGGQAIAENIAPPAKKEQDDRHYDLIVAATALEPHNEGGYIQPQTFRPGARLNRHSAYSIGLAKAKRSVRAPHNFFVRLR